MTDPLATVVPGQPMSPEAKAELAKANASETENAHKMAADRRAQDAMNEPPLVTTLADSIKSKLEQLPPLTAEQEAERAAQEQA